jgi:hypothetical protein
MDRQQASRISKEMGASIFTNKPKSQKGNI